MRICADCQNQILRHDKWKIDGTRIRHISCRNPRLLEGKLPLWKAESPLMALLDQPEELPEGRYELHEA